MTIEEEIKLLKDKLELLEKIYDLQKKLEEIPKAPTYVPMPYPVYLDPWPRPYYLPWTTSATDGTNMPTYFLGGENV
jgi:hypothetical protein